jgi:hypothetical protein
MILQSLGILSKAAIAAITNCKMCTHEWRLLVQPVNWTSMLVWAADQLGTSVLARRTGCVSCPAGMICDTGCSVLLCGYI